MQAILDFVSPTTEYEVLMARVTVEDCLNQVANRFALVILASDRARMLSNGAAELVECTNKPAVTALREIACLLYTSPSPRDATLSRMPSSA